MNKGLQQIYKKVLYVSRLMNLLLSEIGDFLEKKIICVNETKINYLKPSGRPERSIINEEMEKSIWVLSPYAFMNEFFQTFKEQVNSHAIFFIISPFWLYICIYIEV